MRKDKNNNLAWEVLGVAVAIFIAVVIIITVFSKVIANPGLAPGTDVVSFAHSTAVVVDYFKEYHHFPPVDLSWYAGFEMQGAPSLIYLYLGTIYYFTNDIEMATRIFHPLGVAILFLVMFYVMKKEKFPTLNAWIASLAYAFIPIVFLSYYSYTKLVALFILPFLFYFTNKILREPQRKFKYISLLAIGTALAVYSHPMSAIIFVVSLFIYSVLYAVLDHEIDSRRILLVLVGFSLGALLASSYIIPFVLEKANRTSIAPEETFYQANIWQRAKGINIMGTVSFPSTLTVLGGWIILLVAPLFVLWRSRRAQLKAIYIAGLVVLVVSFAYVFFPLGYFFPFNLTYAYIWLYFTAFSLAYLLGSAIPLTTTGGAKQYLVRFLLGILVVVVFFSVVSKPLDFPRVANQDWPSGEIKLAKYLSNFSESARIMASHYPLSEIGWPIWLYSGGKPEVEGHYYGVARIARQIAFINDALHNNYTDYVLKKLKFFNVRYFIANRVLWDIKHPIDGELLGRKMIKKIEANGFDLVYEIDATESYKEEDPHNQIYRLYVQDLPSTYVQPIEEKILVVGKYGSTLAAAASAAKITMLEGGSIYLDDYDLEFLKNFETIFLYGFGYHDKGKAEELARQYAQGGGKLVIELFGMENSKLEENPSFLGVTGHARKITDPVAIQTTASVRELLPETFEFPGEIFDTTKRTGKLDWRKMDEWNALEYINLDESWAWLPGDDGLCSILGIKNIEDKRVIFVGLNIFYHLYNSHNLRELELVRRLATNFLPNSNLSAANELNFSATEEITNNQYWRYQISSDKDRLVLVSLAYSPHWQARVDGQDVKVYHVEDLMVVKLPAGQHTLEMVYSRTPVKNVAVAISTFMACFLVWVLIIERLFRKKDRGQQ